MNRGTPILGTQCAEIHWMFLQVPWRKSQVSNPGMMEEGSSFQTAGSHPWVHFYAFVTYLQAVKVVSLRMKSKEVKTRGE